MGEGGENYPSKRVHSVPAPSASSNDMEALLERKDNEIASLKQRIHDLQSQLHEKTIENMNIQAKARELELQSKLDPRLLQQQELLSQKQHEINEKHRMDAEAARAVAAEAARADAEKRVQDMKAAMKAVRGSIFIQLHQDALK